MEEGQFLINQLFEGKSKVSAYSLPENMWKAVKLEAKRLKASQSDVVQRAISEYFRNRN